jgi:hypothetical protein
MRRKLEEGVFGSGWCYWNSCRNVAVKSTQSNTVEFVVVVFLALQSIVVVFSQPGSRL